MVIFGYELSRSAAARARCWKTRASTSQIKIVSLGAAPSLPGLIAEPAMVAELATMYGAGLPCCFVAGDNVGDFKRLAAAADDGSLRRRLGDAGALDPHEHKLFYFGGSTRSAATPQQRATHAGRRR